MLNGRGVIELARSSEDQLSIPMDRELRAWLERKAARYRIGAGKVAYFGLRKLAGKEVIDLSPDDESDPSTAGPGQSAT